MKNADLKTKMAEHPEVSVSHSSEIALHEERHRPSAVELAGAVMELVKIRITFFVGMSAAFGYILATGEVSLRAVAPVLGIFLLSCASAALNHYQERDTDALMRRTNKRPLPSGLVLPASVLAMIGILAMAGSGLLYLTGTPAALVFSWLAFFSYNLVYTPLKRITPFAVIPGSFVGSFPVMAGWAAARGNILDPRLLAVAIFFFIWQIPHFWVLMEMYSSDYERAGFPTLRMYFSEGTTSRLIYIWTVALAAVSVLLVSSRVVNNLLPSLAILAFGLWLVVSTSSIVRRPREGRTMKAAFMKINIYVLAVTAIVMIDRIFSLIKRGL